MRVIDTIRSDEMTTYTGNGVSYRVNMKANKATINFNHSSEKVKQAIINHLQTEILEILKPYLLEEK